MENEMKKLVCIALLIVTFTGCVKKNAPDKTPYNNDYQISAEIKGLKDSSVVIVSDATNGKVLDSTIITKGKFTSQGSIDHPPLPVNIMIKNNSERVHSIIYIGNENIQIKADKKDFPNNIDLEGSKYHKYKRDLDQRTDSLKKLRSRYLQKMFSLRSENKWNDSLQNAYWSEKDGIITHIDQQIHNIDKRFIEDNINSHYALFHLVTNKSQYENEYIRSQLGKLNSKFRNSKYAKVLETYIKNKDLKQGDDFYDFEAETQKGKKVKFSSFFHGKYVLLEFYSSYCVWCKKALPEIKNLAHDEEDLNIISFNVDSNKSDWLAEKKNWPSLYDPDGRLGGVFTKYRVSATPTYFLFNQKGKLIQRWNGYSGTFSQEVKKAMTKRGYLPLDNEK